MQRVTGIGGIFFKSKDPKVLRTWYDKHLGVSPLPDGEVIFRWREVDRPEETGYTAWSIFPQNTRYLDPSTASFMINYRVADLHALLAQLRAEGIEVDEKTEESEFGKFGWVMDPEGNRIELWEPPQERKELP